MSDVFDAEAKPPVEVRRITFIHNYKWGFAHVFANNKNGQGGRFLTTLVYDEPGFTMRDHERLALRTLNVARSDRVCVLDVSIGADEFDGPIIPDDPDNPNPKLELIR